MIPPVEERMVKRCRSCVFSHEDDFGDQICQMTFNVNRDHDNPLKPCKYHFTLDEMTELLDSVMIP